MPDDPKKDATVRKFPGTPEEITEPLPNVLDWFDWTHPEHPIKEDIALAMARRAKKED